MGQAGLRLWGGNQRAIVQSGCWGRVAPARGLGEPRGSAAGLGQAGAAGAAGGEDGQPRPRAASGRTGGCSQAPPSPSPALPPPVSQHRHRIGSDGAREAAAAPRTAAGSAVPSPAEGRTSPGASHRPRPHARPGLRGRHSGSGASARCPRPRPCPCPPASIPAPAEPGAGGAPGCSRPSLQRGRAGSTAEERRLAP